MKMYNKDGKVLGDFKVCTCGHLQIQHFAKGYPDGWCCHTDLKYENNSLIRPVNVNCTCRKFVHCEAFDKDSGLPSI